MLEGKFMDKSDIKVSICCAVYNHEKYLRKCLDGFVSQKTNFRYEVLIHDDASTDASADIIREYEARYPDLIKPIFQKENQYSKGVKISWTYQYPRAKGKYIALCEGDDYWCDEDKLQLQYDEMEKNDEIVMCVHNVACINESGKAIDLCYPQKKIPNKLLSSDKMMELMVEHKTYPFQTSSYFIKSDYIKKIINNLPKFIYASNVGDVPIMFFLITKGKFYYIHKTMSYYRMGGPESWNSMNNSKEKRIIQTKNDMATYLLFDNYSNSKYTSYINRLLDLKLYYIYQLTNDYKMICSKQLRWVLKKEPFKQQVFYKLAAYVPGFIILYSRARKNKNLLE